MARSTILTFSLVVFLFLVSNCIAAGILGGRTKIKDVKTNKVVQALGKYSVNEYNKLQRHHKRGARRYLKFSKVMEAESQLVSGVNYYLKIATVSKSWKHSKVFNAEVLVKPWKHSKQLLSFKPARK